MNGTVRAQTYDNDSFVVYHGSDVHIRDLEPEIEYVAHPSRNTSAHVTASGSDLADVLNLAAKVNPRIWQCGEDSCIYVEVDDSPLLVSLSIAGFYPRLEGKS